MDSDPNQKNLQATNAPTDPPPFNTTLSPISTQLLQNQNSTPTNTLQQTKRLGKSKMLPTRRSLRLQTKQKVNSNHKETSPKQKSRMGKLPFDLDSRDLPLDVDAVFTILQATGLQINNEIRQKIQDSLMENPTTGTPEVTTPGTPLHDTTPPLAIPGEEMVL